MEGNSEISFNETYIQNPDFPSNYGEDDDLTYTIKKINNGMQTMASERRSERALIVYERKRKRHSEIDRWALSVSAP